MTAARAPRKAWYDVDHRPSLPCSGERKRRCGLVGGRAGRTRDTGHPSKEAKRTGGGRRGWTGHVGADLTLQGVVRELMSLAL